MAQTPDVIPPPVPADGLLLHVGVFKTGTTALQETLRHSTNSLDRHDVRYRGPSSWQFAPLRNLANRDAAQWRELVRDVAEHSGRVMVSSENLCGCSDDEARSVYRQLAGSRPVHILLTVRSLAELLPSTWQQLLKRGMSQSYEDWLRRVIADEDSASGVFWRRNNFPALVRRWGDLAGQDNVTVVVSDKAQPNRLLRVTEGFLGLPQETLHFSAEGKRNQSLSYAEAELLRQVNESVLPGIGEGHYHRLVRLGMFPAMHRIPQERPAPIPLPQWAADAMSQLGADQATALRETSATIVGDLDALAQQPRLVEANPVPPTEVPMQSAAAAVIGALKASHKQLGASTPPAPTAQPSRLRRVAGYLRRSS